MKKILIISTGGTFSKEYNPINGKLEVDPNAFALEDIAKKWRCEFEILKIIAKDSIDVTNHDRLELLGTINLSSYHEIIVVHGTDTMDVTAAYLAEAELEKTILLTGAMVPYSIDPVEATANLCAAYGYLQMLNKEGVFISMNGVLSEHENVTKNRVEGRFTLVS